MIILRSTARHGAIIALTLGAAAGACRSAGRRVEPDGGVKPPWAAAPDASAKPAIRYVIDAGPIATSIPVPVSKLEETINRDHRPPYAGPVGAVEGTVRVAGDPAPAQNVDAAAGCGDAVAMYGKLFREGPGRTVADAMVAVTEYDGFVPAKSDVYPVAIRGCAYDRRTLALTYGQRIEVKNYDAKEPYLPDLVGANMPAKLLAIPRGEVVRLYPTEVGQYLLGESMGKAWMRADVFVVRFSTHAVTGTDGHYRIDGIPAGKAKVSAYLPAIRKTVDRKIVVKAGEATKVDLVIPFKPAKEPVPKPAGPNEVVIQ